MSAETEDADVGGEFEYDLTINVREKNPDYKPPIQSTYGNDVAEWFNRTLLTATLTRDEFEAVRLALITEMKARK